MNDRTVTVPVPGEARDVAAAFERAWRAAGVADLADFLPLPDDPTYPRLLRDLIRLDVQLHREAGRPRPVSDYSRAYPTAFADEALAADLAPDGFGAADRTRPIVVRGDVPPTGQLVDGSSLKPRTVVVSSTAMPKAGDRYLQFDIVRELGRGVFGRVFLARQTDLADRLVVLKVTSESDAEPQILARLQHTNIVPIYAVYQHGTQQTICMPYFGSVTLRRVIRDLARNHKTMPGTGRGLLSTLFEARETATEDPAQAGAEPATVGAPGVERTPSLEALAAMTQVEAALWIAARLADGLAHAHERGVLHCDLKPANVLIADDGQPMLLDFNVAADQRAKRGKSWRLGGTLPYMAPEHLELAHAGAGDLTPACDLYSLGVVLYELLTGSLPFQEPEAEPDNLVQLYLTLHRLRPEPPSRKNRAITPAVDAIVVKLMDPDPAKRYKDAGQAREDLERQLANRPLAHARDRSPRERMRKWRRRYPRLSAAVMVAAAAVVFLIAPTTVLAVRQNQIAERRHEVARSEAILAQQRAVRELRTVQALLSARVPDRAAARDGLARGRAVVEEYGLDTDAGWASRSKFTLLTEQQQSELRRELGDCLLYMVRGEMVLAPEADKTAAAAALRWNRLAEQCFPADDRPRVLARQRAALLKIIPGEAEPLEEPAPRLVDTVYEGIELMMAGKPADALRQLLPFTDDHPDHFLAWYTRAAAHEAVAQYADSAAAYTVCATLWPDFPHTYYNRGLARFRQGKYEAAEADFTRALDRKPEWTNAQISRALARNARQDFAGAEKDLTAVVGRADAPTRVYFIRSRVRQSLGDKAGAEADAAAGRKLTPTDDVSWVSRGVWSLDRDAKGALADYEEALRLNPRSRDALQNKAVVLADYLQRPGDAVKAMDQLLELYPSYTEARAGRAVYLARIGEAKRAKEDAAIVLREEPTAYRLYQMSSMYAQLSKTDPTGSARQESLRLLAQSFRTGFANFDMVAKDEDMAPLRDDPAFREIVAHAKKLQLAVK
ncbi:MAG TPA: serine/threonine-protein kinase [Gemmataceae bacterium]|nr:serine/threonine-protein kinase [Gemmataceae bacterium]